MTALNLLAAWITASAILTLLWVLAFRRPHHNPRTQQNERQSHDGGEGLRAADFQSIHNGEISNG